MWHNNGFGSNGQFPNNFNNQDDFPPSPFAASSSPAANGYFPLLLPVVQYEEANGTQFNDFQPEVGPFNKDAFMQNQQIMSADVQVRFVETGLDLQDSTHHRFVPIYLPQPVCYLQVPKLTPVRLRPSSLHRPLIYPKPIPSIALHSMLVLLN